MRTFEQKLAALQPGAGPRSWLFVPEDQLSDQMGPLSREAPRSLGIVLVENAWKHRRRPYHRQRLALVLANQRQFALEQAKRGVAVRYLTGCAPFADLLAPLAAELGPLRMARPAERELRADLAEACAAGWIVETPHEGWITRRDHFEAAFPNGRRWKLDTFYRRVRRETGTLMEGGRPLGGRFSYDAENRRSWPGDPPAARPPRFTPDEITAEVIAEVAASYARHPGRIDPTSLPATLADSEALWAWALESCLEHFGPYQDALSTRSTTLFHTRISALLNLHRLLPLRVVRDAETSPAPLASREGFVRQVLGWREFVHHVHEASDGFRELEGEAVPVRSAPGDGGFERWSGRAWELPAEADRVDGGAAPSRLGSDHPLPPVFWGQASGLACLDRCVRDVWEESYGHHIARLMVLSNIANLLDVSPRELADWFWVAYSDAHDWVVEPNVLGMGTFALGDLFTTKPYVSGSAYIDRMSDYCAGCRFSPKRDCPLTRLYWAFLGRHRERLSDNPRMRMAFASLRRRSPAERKRDEQAFEQLRDALREGRELPASDAPAGSGGANP